MSAEVDRPSTWKVYQEGACSTCIGSCCTLPVEVSLEDLLRLGLISAQEARGSRKKLARRLLSEGKIQEHLKGTDFFILGQRPNRQCHFFDPIKFQCGVYEVRPQTCRDFPSVGPRPGHCPINRRF